MNKIVSYVLLTVKMGKEHELAEKIQKIKGVNETLIVYGQYDMVIRVETVNLSELDYIVTFIRKMEGVEQTSTLIAT